MNALRAAILCYNKLLKSTLVNDKLHEETGA